jgi:hypothetical protein
MLVESTTLDRASTIAVNISRDVESMNVEETMKRRLRIGALSLACLVGLSVPLIGAGGATTHSTAKICTTVRHDETRLVWNAAHTAKIQEIVYRVVPERTTIDGHKPYINVAIAVTATERVCAT